MDIPNQPQITHPWTISPTEAKEIQEKLRTQVILEDQLGEVRYVAGVDAGFEDDYKITKAAVAVLTFPELQVVETATAKIKTTFPYIPGFLSFREVPALLEGLKKIQTPPDLILCDGQGYAHPRRFGLACHLGVLLDCPTIGVAKSRFIGQHNEVGPKKGDWIPLEDKGEVIGAVLRSRSHVKPLYISVGHKISLPTAIDYVLRCTTRYKLPETTRLADYLASTKDYQ